MGDQNINSKGIKPIILNHIGYKGDFEEEETIEVHEDFYGMDTSIGIKKVTDQLRKMLTEKNKRYGDSALKPIKVFSKDNAKKGLYIRADDKLSRIKNSTELRKNDVADLMGYCVLICMAKGWYDWSDLID